EGENRRQARRRFPGRTDGGFFPGLRTVGKGQRPPSRSLRPLLASSSRSHFQSLRACPALRRLSRQAPPPGLAQHQGTTMKITILDYGAGNVPSVERALQRLGAESLRTGSPECISNSEAVLLPGVGHYSALVRALDEKNLRSPLVEA